MKSKKLFLLLAFCTIYCFAETQNPLAEDIAQQMHDLAPQCQILSSKEMREARSAFLKKNEKATIQDLVDAINTPIEGQDIISYFRSFGSCPVCEEHAKLLETDKSNGIWAIGKEQEKKTIETLLRWHILS